MLEILAVIFMSKKVGAIAADKGHSRALYITLFVILWFFGEAAGYILGTLAVQGEPFLVYLSALGGAAFGALLGYVIIDSLPDCMREDENLELDHTGRRRPQSAWNPEHFQPGAQAAGTDSEHVQLGTPVTRHSGSAGSDSTGIQARE